MEGNDRKRKIILPEMENPQGVQACIIEGLESWGLRKQQPDL